MEHSEKDREKQQGEPDPEIGVLPRAPPTHTHTAGPRHICPGHQALPAPRSLFLSPEKSPSSRLDSTSLPGEREPPVGFLAPGADTSLFCPFLPPALPPLPRPPLPGVPQDKPADAPGPSAQQRAGQGWRGASHCPTGDLSPRTHPHPQPRPGRTGREGRAEGVLLPRHSASGERKGRGEGAGGGDGRPKARPLGQMLTQLRAPGPRGVQEALPPHWLGASPRDEGRGSGLAPLQCLSLRLGLREEHRDGPGAARTGWGTAPPRPPGGVGGVPSAGSSSQQMKTRPQERAGHRPCSAPGETSLLRASAPTHPRGRPCPTPWSREGARRLPPDSSGLGLQPHGPSPSVL